MEKERQPLALCAYCHALNRPKPATHCRTCGLDLREQHATLAAGGLSGLFASYAPNGLDAASYRHTFNREQMAVLIHTFALSWEAAGQPADQLPDELAAPHMERVVHLACLQLGLIPPPSPSRAKWAFYYLAKIVHPDVGGSDTAFKTMQNAYQRLRTYTATQTAEEQSA